MSKIHSQKYRITNTGSKGGVGTDKCLSDLPVVERGLEQRSGSHYHLQVFTQRESCFRGAASTLNTSVMCNVYTSSFSFFDCVTPLEIS